MDKPLEEMNLNELKMAYVQWLVESNKPFTFDPSYYNEHRLFVIKEEIEQRLIQDLKSAYRTYRLVNGV